MPRLRLLRLRLVIRLPAAVLLMRRV
eukprot:COSAG04_NODE_28413_length_276_cov_0.519774_1_plen_25_part_10